MLWKQLKSLGYNNKSAEKSKLVLKINDNMCHDDKANANHFNNYFTTIASKLVDMLPNPFNEFSVHSKKFVDFYKNKGVKENSFKLSEVNENFVYKELINLNPCKSTGLDNISPRFLKDGACVLKNPILHIINLSLNNNDVPDDFKLAKVKPLYKKEERTEVGNYRPISVLCIVSKILERAVYNQVEEYLNTKDLLYNYQSGFRKKFSTDSCLIHLTDFIRENTSQGKYTGAVLLDLQKAFDTVDHTILIKKMEKIGLGSLKWFRSYLSNRKQIVEINGKQSDSKTVTCGVPQGSILGPLLFLIYVNDMSISVNCKLMLYADDSILLVSDKDHTKVSEFLTLNLNSCFKWLVDNKLSLHLGKTEAIVFGSKRKINKLKSFEIKCNGHSIKTVTMVKYLGVEIDNSISGELIAENVVKKTGNRLKFLYRHSKCLNQHCKKILCSALCQSYFDYACSSWFTGIGIKYKNKLQIIQNKIVRFITNKDSRSHIGALELQEINMINVNDRVNYLKMCHVFKIKNDSNPKYLKEKFNEIPHLHNTRYNEPNNFFLPRVQGTANNTFYFSAIREWNSLPNSIKSINKLDTFKSQLKEHYFKKEIIFEQL